MSSHVATRRGVAMRMISLALTALLLAGFPGAGLAWAAEVGAAAATGDLSLTTDPPGATVYVDGLPRGTTPFTASALPAGDHHVKVAKQGYFDDRRVVRLAPGQTEAVQFKMTRAGSAALSAAAQVEDEQEKDKDKDKKGGGGGGKKVVLIGLGVAAAAAVAVVVLKGGNKPPLAGSVSVTPSGTGLQGATTFSLSASGASDPDSDPLTFNWNLGDGTSATGQTVTKTYSTAGTFNVTVTVSDGKASATANGTVTVRALAGAWTGTLAGTANTVVNFSQSGSTLGGNVQFTNVNLPTGTISGTVSNPRAVTFTVTAPGFQPFTFVGTVDEAGNRLSGLVNGSGFVNAPWVLNR
jgi:hypothetical protein